MSPISIANFTAAFIAFLAIPISGFGIGVAFAETIQICQDKAGTDDSVLKAKNWVAKNASVTGAGAAARSNWRILIGSRVEDERLRCRVVISGAEARDNLASGRIRITETTDGDLVAVVGEGGQRPLALLIGEMSAKRRRRWRRFRPIR